MLHRFISIYEARMSPALNGSSAIRCFERSDAIEIRDGITFDFYTGLPHMVNLTVNFSLTHGSMNMGFATVTTIILPNSVNENNLLSWELINSPLCSS